jgi:hypothetical protein
MDNRGASTVVEKLLSLGIVLLYITLLTTVLYGHNIPAYRATVGTELGERTLTEATARVEQAVPPAGESATVTHRVELPATINGAAYDIRVDGNAMVLDHPDGDIGARTYPVLPDRVTTLTGEWHSGGSLVITATGPGDDLTVRIGDEP